MFRINWCKKSRKGKEIKGTVKKLIKKTSRGNGLIGGGIEFDSQKHANLILLPRRAYERAALLCCVQLKNPR